MAIGLPQKLTLHPVSGVRLGAAAAGIKYQNRDDLVLIEVPQGGTVAAVFTTNAFCAAPVIVSRQHLEKNTPRFLVINSGNANAGMGEQGMKDAMRSCHAVAEVCGCGVEQVLPFSTGVIGEPLAVDKIIHALPQAHHNLDENGWEAAAKAIMTTDTVAKGCTRRIEIDGCPVTVTGIVKGSGMIEPNMATLLAYIATDAAVHPDVLDACLKAAVEDSFNSISVDGDTSTNDACVLIASGQSDLPPIESISSPGFQLLSTAIGEVCLELAQSVIRDAEGVTKMIHLVVDKGRDVEECRQVARTVALSPLVKTAFFGCDPNWGRILAAVGRAGVDELDVTGVEIYLDQLKIAEQGGRALDYSESKAAAIMQQEEIRLRVSLGRGEASTQMWVSDFSYDYVRINATYRT